MDLCGQKMHFIMKEERAIYFTSEHLVHVFLIDPHEPKLAFDSNVAEYLRCCNYNECSNY